MTLGAVDDDVRRPGPRWSLEGFCAMEEEYVEDDWLDDIERPRGRPPAQDGCEEMTEAAGAGASSWRGSGWRRRTAEVAVEGAPSRIGCLILICRGREKLPIIMAVGGPDRGGVGVRNADRGGGGGGGGEKAEAIKGVCGCRASARLSTARVADSSVELEVRCGVGSRGMKG